MEGKLLKIVTILFCVTIFWSQGIESRRTEPEPEPCNVLCQQLKASKTPAMLYRETHGDYSKEYDSEEMAPERYKEGRRVKTVTGKDSDKSEDMSPRHFRGESFGIDVDMEGKEPEYKTPAQLYIEMYGTDSQEEELPTDKPQDGTGSTGGETGQPLETTRTPSTERNYDGAGFGNRGKGVTLLPKGKLNVWLKNGGRVLANRQKSSIRKVMRSGAKIVYGGNGLKGGWVGERLAKMHAGDQHKIYASSKKQIRAWEGSSDMTKNDYDNSHEARPLGGKDNGGALKKVTMVNESSSSDEEQVSGWVNKGSKGKLDNGHGHGKGVNVNPRARDYDDKPFVISDYVEGADSSENSIRKGKDALSAPASMGLIKPPKKHA